jgi:hypothetical protein
MATTAISIYALLELSNGEGTQRVERRRYAQCSSRIVNVSHQAAKDAPKGFRPSVHRVSQSLDLRSEETDNVQAPRTEDHETVSPARQRS